MGYRCPLGALSGVPNVRPQQSPETAPLSARDWAKYLVQERASKQQKVRDSPATEPARPSDGRFKVWHSPAVELTLTELTEAVEETFLPMLRADFCLAQREAVNAVLEEQGIQCRLPTSAKRQRFSFSMRDVRLLTGGDEASQLHPIALDRVKDAFACARC